MDQLAVVNYPRIRPERQSRSRLPNSSEGLQEVAAIRRPEPITTPRGGKSCRYRSTSRLLRQYAWYISALCIAGRKGARRRRRSDAGGGPGHPRAQQNIYQLVLGKSIYGAIWQRKSSRGSDLCSAPVRARLAKAHQAPLTNILCIAAHISVQ